MPTPSTRTPVRIARGSYSNLNGSVSDLHDGEISYAEDQNTLYIKEGTSLVSLTFAPASPTFTGDVTFTGAANNVVFDASDNALEFADNAKASFGANADLQIYHDGSNSYLVNTTGELRITDSSLIRVNTDDFRIYKGDGTELTFRAEGDGACSLYYDNTVRFSTNASGVEVHGNLQIDDSNIAKFGTGGDLEIYHDGSNSYIKDAGTGGIYIDTSFLHVRQGSAESMINAIADGAVELYYDNVKKIETTAQAVKITGGIAQVVTAAAALELDLNTSNYFTKTISGNSTFTFANPAASGQVTAFTLELTHSSGTVTWPSSVKWNADTAPTLTAGKTHLFMFVTDDGGTRYRGSALVDYVN